MARAKTPQEKKTELVQVKVSSRTKARLERVAAIQELGTATFVRQAALREASRIEEEFKLKPLSDSDD